MALQISLSKMRVEQSTIDDAPKFSGKNKLRYPRGPW